jgi:hypothetical protein
VVLDQAAAGPRAGGDHRCRGPQGGPFQRVQFRGLAGRQPGLVTERQVHQDNRAQPAGLGLDQVRHRAGHQAVEQDKTTIRYARQHAGQCRTVGRARPWPAALDRERVYRPAGLGEDLADPAVVAVAPARCGRIVETARQDDVQGPRSGHRARS